LRPGAQALGRNSTFFAVILNVFLIKNLDQNMLKNAYFLEKKTVKIISASEAPPLNHRLPPAAEGSAPFDPLRCYSHLLLELCQVRF